ncbi:ABC transporter ATP-binding protein [Lachnospiraceae bacterium ZAX-1]
MKQPILEMVNITKKFGPVIANKNVNLFLYPGEIHALLGENGAGKSTLMNILTGIYKPNKGQIYYKGEKVSIKSPKHAIDLGIGMLHQHFRLIPTLSVAENIYLYLPSCSFVLNAKKMEDSIYQCSKDFNLEVDAHAKVWQLSVGEQQRVEIVKLLYRGAQILILDEPSAVLTPLEAEEMFKTLRKMAETGKSVVIISHKLNEVMNHADRITVLRGGMVKDSMMATDATVERLTQGIVGNRTIIPVSLHTPHTASSSIATQGISLTDFTDNNVLRIKNLFAQNDKDLPALKDISFDIKAGEIFGIAGVAGNGQRELAEVIAGLRTPTAGIILLNGQDITAQNVKQCIQHGISFIPEDRLHMGLVPAMNLKENAILKSFDTPKFSRHCILNRKSMQASATKFVEFHDIKTAGIDTPVSLMSGGNQQKLLIAREIEGEPSLIIAAYPVHGLDIGATAAIHQILLEQRKRGVAILLVSEELEEIFKMSDRIGVLCNGELMAIKQTTDTDYAEIGKLMAGERV